jgi:polar amino acid transport system permease protein/octopine/nopaline transport system permease protein
MNPRQVFFRITLPRAVRICLPAMSTETILLLKATVLASLVTVYEVMGTATSIRVDTFRVYDTLVGAGIIYFCLVFLLTRVLNWVERKLNKDRMPVSSVVPKPAAA